jgi:hypothetical protein
VNIRVKMQGPYADFSGAATAGDTRTGLLRAAVGGTEQQSRKRQPSVAIIIAGESKACLQSELAWVCLLRGRVLLQSESTAEPARHLSGDLVKLHHMMVHQIIMQSCVGHSAM